MHPNISYRELYESHLTLEFLMTIANKSQSIWTKYIVSGRRKINFLAIYLSQIVEGIHFNKNIHPNIMEAYWCHGVQKMGIS